MMGKNFRDTLEEQLRDPEFRAEIEALKPKRETGLKAETIKDLFAKFYGEYMREEIDWGKPVGEEICFRWNSEPGRIEMGMFRAI